MTKLEYENLMTALNLALDAHVSILNIYRALDSYLDTSQEHQLGLQLGEHTLKRLEQYPPEQLTGELAFEFVGIIDTVAKRQMLLKQYVEAEKSYQKALATLLASKQETAKKFSSSIYHQLGVVTQDQRQWTQAEQYFQQALQIFIEFNDRFSQASTYGQLGLLAQDQRQWSQAEHYFQQALQIKIEFNDRYNQALTYQALGSVALVQQQRSQADQYYRQALQIYIEYNDRHSQAQIHYNLGLIAQEQQQWEEASNYLLQDLEISVAYEDTYSAGITLRSLARVWQASGNAELPAQVAAIVGWSVEEVEKWFGEALQGEEGEGEE